MSERPVDSCEFPRAIFVKALKHRYCFESILWMTSRCLATHGTMQYGNNAPRSKCMTQTTQETRILLLFDDREIALTTAYINTTGGDSVPPYSFFL